MPGSGYGLSQIDWRRSLGFRRGATRTRGRPHRGGNVAHGVKGKPLARSIDDDDEKRSNMDLVTGLCKLCVARQLSVRNTSNSPDRVSHLARRLDDSAHETVTQVQSLMVEGNTLLLLD